MSKASTGSPGGQGQPPFGTCRDVLQALTEYLEGDLPTREHGEFESHMVGCNPCDSFFRTYRTSTDLARETLSIEDVPRELQDRVRTYLKLRLGLRPGGNAGAE